MLIFCCLIAIGQPVFSQSKPDGQFKIALDENGHYFRITFLNQTWLRYTQYNEGTTVVEVNKNAGWDIGLRRTRMQLFGPITDRVFFYMQIGQNNFNRAYNYGSNRKVAFFVHDALGEYKLSKGEQLKLGGGLTIAHGVSRFSQPSIGTILTMDVPVFAQTTVDQIDEFSRTLAVYARGQIGKVDYRFVVSDPFPIASSGAAVPPIGADAAFAAEGHHPLVHGYVMYQFFEHEQHQTPYMSGTYLGSKKIFNIAGGYMTQKDALWNLQNGQKTFHNLQIWAVESFLDMPLNKEKGTAISAYSGYFSTDYGPNYLRFNGLMNPATGSNAINTVGSASANRGNAHPMFGTGTVWYSQMGYLLPKNLLGEGKPLLQPYTSFTHASYDKLQGKAMNLYNVGLNMLFSGHRAKLSLDYQNRPTYTQSGQVVSLGNRKSCVILQYQISI